MRFSRADAGGRDEDRLTFEKKSTDQGLAHFSLGWPAIDTPRTSLSLLDHARDPTDAAAWRRLTDLYTPLIRGWARRYTTQPADADDVVQEVLAILVREIPQFEHSRHPGAFRAWLRGMTVNRLRILWRTRTPATGNDAIFEQLHQLEDPASPLSRSWDAEHDLHVANTLLHAIRLEFQPATWRAFEGTVRDGRSTAEVADELGLSVNAVLIAKSRVLKRLREKSAGLIE